MSPENKTKQNKAKQNKKLNVILLLRGRGNLNSKLPHFNGIPFVVIYLLIYVYFLLFSAQAGTWSLVHAGQALCSKPHPQS
jgi:hypothetical protein